MWFATGGVGAVCGVVGLLAPNRRLHADDSRLSCRQLLLYFTCRYELSGAELSTVTASINVHGTKYLQEEVLTIPESHSKFLRNLSCVAAILVQYITKDITMAKPFALATGIFSTFALIDRLIGLTTRIGASAIDALADIARLHTSLRDMNTIQKRSATGNPRKQARMSPGAGARIQQRP